MELIICEKPKAAQKVAEALADGKPKKESFDKKVPYYTLTHNKKKITVAPAVGHLYSLAEKEKKGWIYPVFDIEWVPIGKVSKEEDYSRKYLDGIKRLAKDADEFTIATDYDVEGEVIGLNIIRYACSKKDANRMKFSTLTDEELVNSYEHKSKHLDWGQAHAGEARHILDWYYGINTSRALTTAIKTTGSFALMSSGRVQGPALKIIVDREKEIKAFKPVPFWQIELLGEIAKKHLSAWHIKDKFWDKSEAKEVYEKVRDEKKAKVAEVKKSQFQQPPPHPFDLTSLQLEAYKTLGISPKHALEIAQDLYTSGFISYPRTSSQQLPKEINYLKILKALGALFPEEAELLLAKKELVPNQGKKTDPAHPAIYPTGVKPSKLNKEQHNLYELIARRFLAAFGDPAVRQTISVKLDVKAEIFAASGTTTLEKGWHTLYGRFAMVKEEELPDMKENDTVSVKRFNLHEDETKPPHRYTEASIIKELEKRNLGTKATRATIIDTLYQRNYIMGRPQIRATDLGIQTIDTLHKYNPEIIDEQLTRHFEEEMVEIREKKKTEEEILEEAKSILIKIMEKFRKHEKDIGKELLKANKETKAEMTVLGKCPKCKKGDLAVRRGKFGQFIGCTSYPKCGTIFKLPHGFFVPAKLECEHCGFPMVNAIRKGRKPQPVCFNPECPSKHITAKEEKIDRKCPKCGKTLIVKSSVYGKFLACPGYPACKHIERIESSPKFNKKEEKKENK